MANANKFIIKGEEARLGSRFYTLISDDEYKIYSFIKFDTATTGQFLDEETGEICTITKEDLIKYYTLLTDYKFMLFAKVDTIEFGTVILHNEELREYFKNNPDTTKKIHWSMPVLFYKFVKKSVFNKMLNYILNLNYPQQSLSDNDLDHMWKVYFTYMVSNGNVPIFSSSSIMPEGSEREIVNEEDRLSDATIMMVEEELDTYIFSYDIYEYDDSVNINNVTMRHFMIYDEKNDKYFLVRYIVDTAKVSAKTISDMNDCMDVVEFMSQ